MRFFRSFTIPAVHTQALSSVRAIVGRRERRKLSRLARSDCHVRRWCGAQLQIFTTARLHRMLASSTPPGSVILEGCVHGTSQHSTSHLLDESMRGRRGMIHTFGIKYLRVQNRPVWSRGRAAAPARSAGRWISLPRVDGRQSHAKESRYVHAGVMRFHQSVVHAKGREVMNCLLALAALENEWRRRFGWVRGKPSATENNGWHCSSGGGGGGCDDGQLGVK